MSSHLRPGLPSRLFPSACPTKPRTHFPSPARLLHAPTPAHTFQLLQSPVPPSLTPSSTALPIQTTTTNNFITHFNPRPFLKRKKIQLMASSNVCARLKFAVWCGWFWRNLGCKLRHWCSPKYVLLNFVQLQITQLMGNFLRRDRH